MHQENTERIWHLLARRTAGEITADEIHELDGLLQQHPHALYMQELLLQDWHDKYKPLRPADLSLMLERHKQRLEASIKQGTASEIHLEPERFPEYKQTNTINRLSYWIAAAGILVILWLGLQWWQSPPEKNTVVAMQRLETQMGSRSEILLPDGTQVRLNAGSSLDYPKQFNGSTRDVYLTGEAYFDVVKDKHKPFLVHTNAFTVKVLGTVFNVRAYADEDSAVASLIQGAVEVQLGNNSGRVVALRPNEKLSVATPVDEQQVPDIEPSKNIKTQHQINIRKAPVTTLADSTIAETAWVDNKLVFKNTSFETIAGSLEKWFGTPIRFSSNDKKQLNLTGTFDGESLDEILHAFQLTGASFQYGKDETGVIWIK